MESHQGGGAGGRRAVREEGLEGGEPSGRRGWRAESRGRRGWRMESSQGGGAAGQRAEGGRAGGGDQSGRSSDLLSLKPVECRFTVSRKEVETTTKNTQE